MTFLWLYREGKVTKTGTGDITFLSLFLFSIFDFIFSF
jgi:hypothetical protein